MRSLVGFTHSPALAVLLTLAGCAAPAAPNLAAAHLQAPGAEVIAQQIMSAPSTLKPPRTPFLPQEPRFSIIAHQQPVAALLFTLARDAKVNLDIHSAVTGDITLNALDQTLPQILDRMARQVSLRWQLLAGTLVVGPDTAFVQTYHVDYFNLARRVHATVALANSVNFSEGGGQGSGNSSTTSIDSTADNLFWASLENNLRALLKLPDRGVNKPAGEAFISNALAKALAAGPSNPVGNTARPMSPVDTVEKLSRIEKNLADASRAAAVAPSAPATPLADNLVLVHPETGTITVFAPSTEQSRVRLYLNALETSAHRQVLIEATVVEVLLNDQYQAGVDWGWLAGNGWAVSQTLLGTQLIDAPVTAITHADGNPFTLRMLESFGQVRVLSSPKVMALNNQAAVMKVVDEQVYFTLELSEDRNSDGQISSRQYTSKLHTVPVGLVLQVMPQVSADGLINLNVRPTITNIRSWVEDPAVALLSREGGEPVSSKVPVLQVREMDATLRIRSGQLAMLGGLIQDSQSHQRSGVPGLSRLPLLGDLFSYRDDAVRRVELVVFLRPQLVGPGTLATSGINPPAADFFANSHSGVPPAFETGTVRVSQP